MIISATFPGPAGAELEIAVSSARDGVITYGLIERAAGRHERLVTAVYEDDETHTERVWTPGPERVVATATDDDYLGVAEFVSAQGFSLPMSVAWTEHTEPEL